MTFKIGDRVRCKDTVAAGGTFSFKGTIVDFRQLLGPDDVMAMVRVDKEDRESGGWSEFVTVPTSAMELISDMMKDMKIRFSTTEFERLGTTGACSMTLLVRNEKIKIQISKEVAQALWDRMDSGDSLAGTLTIDFD